MTSLPTLRVAHFIQRYPPALGGSEAYFARLSRSLALRGDAVTVFTSNAVELGAFWARGGACVAAGVRVEDGVEVRRYPLWRFPGGRYLLKALSFYPQRLWQCLTLPCNPICTGMWRDAGRAGPGFDVVHASAFPYAWPIACARRLARRCRAPLALTPFLHGGDPENPHDKIRRGYTAPPLRWLLGQADLVFVQTPSERSIVFELGIPENKVVLQGLGVEPAECTGGDGAKARRDWEVEPGEVVLGHLANNSIEKGTVDLLQAAAILWERGLSAKVILAGPEMPNFRKYWQEFAARHGAKAASQVRRVGVLDDQQKRDFFAGLDLFVLPSRSDSFGLVLLEAWANGVANVAYRAGGIIDVIRQEIDGLLVPCGQVPQLADALGRLITSAAERSRMGRAGLERLTRDFRWEDKLALVRRTYADLANKEKL